MSPTQGRLERGEVSLSPWAVFGSGCSNFVGWPMHVPEAQSLILFWP